MIGNIPVPWNLGRMHIPHAWEHWSLPAIQAVKFFREVQIFFAAYDIFRISATATSRVNVVQCEHMQGKLARNASLVCVCVADSETSLQKLTCSAACMENMYRVTLKPSSGPAALSKIPLHARTLILYCIIASCD